MRQSANTNNNQSSNNINSQQILNNQIQNADFLLVNSGSNNSQPQVELKPGYVQSDHPDADKWFYLDPQNQVQGPFSVEQMAGWFAAGYFTFNLMIKRGCEEKFVPLGNLKERADNLNQLVLRMV